MDQVTEANLATLSRLVAEKGEKALPYPEDLKYGVKTHVAELIKVQDVLCKGVSCGIWKGRGGYGHQGLLGLGLM